MGIRAKIAEAFVAFTADISGLKTGLKNAEKETAGTAGRISTALGTIGRIAFPAGVVASIVASGKAAIDAADQMHEMSIKTGETTENLSVLKYAADQSGASIEEIGVAFKGMANSRAAALSGNKEAIRSFDRLGVSIADLRNLSGKDLLVKVADGIADTKNKADRLALAQDVLGRSAQSLLPTMSELARGGFERTAAEAKKLGLILSSDLARSADEFNDNVGRLASTFKSGANPALQEFLPIVNATVGANMEGAAATSSWLNPLGLFVKALRYAVLPVLMTATEAMSTLVQSASIGLSGLGKASKLLITGSPKKAWDELAKSGKQQMDLVTGFSDRLTASMEKLFPVYEEVAKKQEDTGDTAADMGDAIRDANLAASEAVIQLQLQLAELRGNREETERLLRAQEELTAAKMRAAGVSESLIQKTIALTRENRIAAEVMKNGGAMTDGYAAALERLAAKRAADAARTREVSAIRAAEFVQTVTHANAIPAMLASIEERYSGSMTTMEDMAVETSNTMTSALGDAFYMAMTGDLDDIDDLFKDFFKSLLRQITQFMAQQAVMKLLMSFGGASTLPVSGFSVNTMAGAGVAAAAGGAVFGGGIDFPAFAKGGMVQDPTLGLIGEGRFDEAVIPMPNGAVPVEMFSPERDTSVSINQRIVLDASVLSAMKSSPDEMITVVSADILRGGQILNSIQSRVRK